MKEIIADFEKRVLLIAPTPRDGEITRGLLLRAGLESVIYSDLRQMAKEVSSGAGAILLTEDALTHEGIEDLLEVLKRQPPWSDIPIILLMPGAGHSVSAERVLRSLGNVTLLERPAPMRSLASAVQAAIRGRERQYQARELEEQLRIAVEASELGTFHCDMPLDKIVWNDRCKAHFWLAPDADVDFDLFYSIIHPDDRDRTRAAIEACVVQGNIYDIEYRTVSPQGAVRWIRATGRTYYDDKNQPIRFDGTTQDITERKRAEDELRRSQEQFQAMANSIPQLAWMAKPDGWIFWHNQRWHDYCGSTPEQMRGWGWTETQDPKELPRVLEKWKTAVANGSPWEDTFPIRRHDGEFRWHLSRALPFKDENGSIVLWFGTNTDISDERARAEERERLLQNERIARTDAEKAGRMKDEFLATLSHELRTPLNAILGWSQLIRRVSDPETLDEGLSIIERNARVQVQLIEDLLDMSRIISGKVRLDVQSIDPTSFIHAAIETVTPAAEAKGIHLQKVIAEGTEVISGDAGRLQQVVWNLLSNAIKFTPRGGQIQVVLKRIESSIEISVSDSGRGIKADFLPHVFERFRQADASTTRAYGGLGIGLAIVKQLVELHGGTVHAESDGEGHGSTFTVILPIAAASRALKNDTAATSGKAQLHRVDDARISLVGTTVLVVDDEVDARNLVRRILEERHANVLTAGSAAEALKVLESEIPDVLVSDIGMPHVDGYDLLKQVHALEQRKGVSIPAVALTAFARSEDRTRALLAGYIVHVSKPVEPQELLATVAAVVGRTGAKSKT